MSKSKSPNESGYLLPPKSGRFTKGQSGNPNGRPKGSKGLANVVLRESRQLVRINGPRGSRSVTKLEATVLQLVNKAAQGDIRSQREFIALVRISEEATNAGGSPLTSHEKDQIVMRNLRYRMEMMSAEAASTKPESEKEKSE
jgi:hypothetical protein